MLDFRVKAIRSPANPTVDGLAFRDAMRVGEVRGPLAFASTELFNDAEASTDVIRETVRTPLPHRPDYFKAYSALPPLAVEALGDEAHRHRFP